ncbi:hypothetical protein [Burkholderia ubonensis]|uniref:hypothetical protein n=1 Tax=Burkholderia ubonensis TaxID=101571 RepID=UPI000A95824B|nr:hypothetical protein [Burkholderia ubonensis]
MAGILTLAREIHPDAKATSPDKTNACGANMSDGRIRRFRVSGNDIQRRKRISRVERVISLV